MQLKTPNKPQTLAQIFMTFYLMVTLVNKENKKKGRNIIDEHLMVKLKKEMIRMGNNAPYRRSIFPGSIQDIRDITTTMKWVESFIWDIMPHGKNGKYLTREELKEIQNLIDYSYVKIVDPFRNGEIKFEDL